jgi:hypothetical protein
MPDTINAGSASVVFGWKLLSDDDWDNDHEANGGDLAVALAESGPDLEEMLREKIEVWLEGNGVDGDRVELRIDVTG